MRLDDLPTLLDLSTEEPAMPHNLVAEPEGSSDACRHCGHQITWSDPDQAFTHHEPGSTTDHILCLES